MTTKRSHPCRSSSSGDTSLLSAPFFTKEIHCPVVSGPLRPAPPPNPAVLASVRIPPLEKYRPSIFTIDFPFDAISDGNSRLGSFLEKCCYCRKRIAPDDEVFMYSHLRAFCSVDCREKQMEIDKDLERLTAKPKRKVMGKRVGL